MLVAVSIWVIVSSVSSATYAVAPFGVIAIWSACWPIGIRGAVRVATVMGVTVPELSQAT